MCLAPSHTSLRPASKGRQTMAKSLDVWTTDVTSLKYLSKAFFWVPVYPGPCAKSPETSTRTPETGETFGKQQVCGDENPVRGLV